MGQEGAGTERMRVGEEVEGGTEETRQGVRQVAPGLEQGLGGQVGREGGLQLLQ